MEKVSAYIHIPFCVKRCNYCDFNTYAGKEDLIPAYISALCKEIDRVSLNFSEGIEIYTVYFGGGTPSLISPNFLHKVLMSLKSNFSFIEKVEMTVEVNPGTISLNYLQQINGIGITRLSIGMQSANQAELDLLGRQHDYVSVVKTVGLARKAGIANINLDLIFGIPNQTEKTWKKSLKKAISLKPDHLSLYALTIEDSTPLAEKIAEGMISMPDDDLEAEMYEWAEKILKQSGFKQYEISNWARRDQYIDYRCQHNLQYWRNLPYLGFGAGAHSYFNHMRWENKKQILSYINAINGEDERICTIHPAVNIYSELSSTMEMGETMMMGLRLVREGVNLLDFRNRFGKSVFDVYENEVRRLEQVGLLQIDDDRKRICLTRRGKHLGNQVFMSFLGD
ncbi:MAG TPA: radical SAM family heme chaperone HemW [Anaerolineae bacterium]|nr:radical SAM family heme chaperone HemW [Anaerolineae bacterium]